jgi:hypothetical protein
MLGIGLHGYGFMDSAFRWLMLFNGAQVALIVLGSLPLSMWKSFQDAPSSTGDPGPPGGPKPSSATGAA